MGYPRDLFVGIFFVWHREKWATRHHSNSASPDPKNVQELFDKSIADPKASDGLKIQMVFVRSKSFGPDGDTAFDDGSDVLQFDVKDHVRLIAFKSVPFHPYDPATLRDTCIPSDDFYTLLQNWYDAFESESGSLPKVSEAARFENESLEITCTEVGGRRAGPDF